MPDRTGGLTVGEEVGGFENSEGKIHRTGKGWGVRPRVRERPSFWLR